MTRDGEPPDISQMKVGGEYTVYYLSQRSGKEVGREGVVSHALDGSDGPVVFLHVEQRSCYKHQYVALVDSETTDGEETVAAISVTAESDPPAGDDPPVIGEVYPVSFSVSRKTILGPVDRIVMEDGPGPFLVTG